MIGIVDTISDANPDGTIFSPHVSSMLLHDMNSSPTTTSFHPSPFGTRRLFPLNRQISTISVAEISDRVADTTGTGRCSPATWIAPYVDPQNKYTLPKASSTSVDFGIRESISSMLRESTVQPGRPTAVLLPLRGKQQRPPHSRRTLSSIVARSLRSGTTPPP